MAALKKEALGLLLLIACLSVITLSLADARPSGEDSVDASASETEPMSRRTRYKRGKCILSVYSFELHVAWLLPFEASSVLRV